MEEARWKNTARKGTKSESSALASTPHRRNLPLEKQFEFAPRNFCSCMSHVDVLGAEVPTPRGQSRRWPPTVAPRLAPRPPRSEARRQRGPLRGRGAPRGTTRVGTRHALATMQLKITSQGFLYNIIIALSVSS